MIIGNLCFVLFDEPHGSNLYKTIIMWDTRLSREKLSAMPATFKTSLLKSYAQYG